MKKISLGIFRFHPLLPVFLFLSWLWAGPSFNSMQSALILHESGHLMLARLMHLTVDEMKWTPFGGVIRIKNIESLPWYSVFLLAAGGPAASLLGCVHTKSEA